MKITYTVEIISKYENKKWVIETIEISDKKQAIECLKYYRKNNPTRKFRLVKITREVLRN